MNRVTPFSEIDSFESIAADLGGLFKRGDNEDITMEFPTTVDRYSGDVSESSANLEVAKARCEAGKREQFIVFAGEHAVGLSVITNDLDVPDGIDPSWPNISGFICNPFRGQGLGRLSIETRMQVIRQNFNSHAWTFVKDGNFPSEHLVVSIGFQKTEQTVEGWEGHHLYLFDEASSF